MSFKIVVAEHAGYCFGVKQAIETAERVLSAAGGARMYACGPLIHNAVVMADLARKGLVFVGSPGEIEGGGTLVVRCHGEAPAFYEEAKRKGLHIADTTCPFVRRIAKLAHRARDAGRRVVIVGDAAHPEVRGLNGWCGGEAIVVGSEAEAEGVTSDDLFVVAQTTTEAALFERIAARLSEKKRSVTVTNTICDATTNRQAACRRLAENCDAMLVIGDRNSANTQKLLKIAKKSCKNSYFIENIADLPLKELEKYNTIGVAAGASTPERMIKEVITGMTDHTEPIEKNSMADFMEEIEKSLRLPRAGEIVTGTVIQVSNREVIINLGCKKDGVIPKDEISLEPEQTLLTSFKEGDEVQAKVLKTDDGDGNILLSKKKVVINEHWEDINRALEEKGVLEAKIVKEVNGGVIAVFKEIYGFIPLSQLSDRYVERADEFIGKILPVRVTRVDQKRNKVVFSHKAVLAEERQKRLQEIWEALHIGDVIEGTVMRFTDYGAFVDIGGIDGLLHISEISWGKLKHPQEVLKIGEKINVKILSIIKEKEKISLGYKQNRPEPWSVIDQKYSVGQIIKGRAVQIKDYGVFVELEPGLDGLVHISEIAFKRVQNISDEITVGREVTAKILEIDKDRKRISLSIRETLDRDAEDGVSVAPAPVRDDADADSEAEAVETEPVADETVETGPAGETLEVSEAAEAEAASEDEAAGDEVEAETASEAETEPASGASEDEAAGDEAEAGDDEAGAADSDEAAEDEA